MNYQELRNQYKTFYYHGYEMEETEDYFKVVYNFEIVGLSSFHPTFTCPKRDMKSFKDYTIVQEAVFSLGMVELVSYWKLTCSPTVIVECNTLDATQINWWKKLYYHGLGEFFYINQIQPNQVEFMDLKSNGEKISGKVLDQVYAGNLIPVGGGKDSFVSLDILKDSFYQNDAFIINHVMSAIHSAQAAGYKDKTIQVIRTLDPTMLKLNKEGFLNGHTPFSAIVAFASLLTSILYGKQYICLSNESSANESTIKGETINHQYSKTYEFEMDFKFYKDTYITNEIQYFSMLRPLSELQIACIFATLKNYHSVFRSCNVGSKEEKWCGHCAKCLFVCIILSAFLSNDDLVKIFGADMLNDETMKKLFNELSGIDENKPFECVGTRDEVNTAICMSIQKAEENGNMLPLLYSYYKQTEFFKVYLAKENVYKTYYNHENLLPKEFDSLVKSRIMECWK